LSRLAQLSQNAAQQRLLDFVFVSVMKLRLSVTAYRHQPPETPAWTEIGENGGTLGRSESNDWVLPDPERFISSQHAAIRFVNGDFLLEDLSTNGAFINNASQPVGRGNSVPIHDGDLLTIGDYDITVELMPEDVPLSEPTPEPAPGLEGIGGEFDEASVEWGSDSQLEQGFFGDSSRSADTAGENESNLGVIPAFPEEMGEAFGDFESEPDHVPGHAGFMDAPSVIPDQIPDDFLADFTPGEGFPSETLPATGEMPPSKTPAPADQPESLPVDNAPGGEPIPSFPSEEKPSEAPTPAFDSPFPGPRLSASPPDVHPARPAHAQAQPEPAPPRAEGGLEVAVREIAAGAGIPDLRVPPDQREAFCRLLGSLLREIVSGLVEVLRSRAEIKSQFRIQATVIRPKENNPLKLAVQVDEALEHLLTPTNNAYLPPMEAAEEALADIKAHQLAVMAGMQVALSSLLKQFEPGSLEKYFDAQGGKGMLESKKAWYWEQYMKLYSTIIANAEDNFQELFGEEFAKAYQTQIFRLRQPARDGNRGP
jgi:type VI secretion system protein